MRGLERRVEAGLDPAVESVASVFISRWDVAVADQAPPELRNRLGIAIATRAYRAYRELLGSDRWQGLADQGARPQRMLFASTGTKDPDASDVLYIEALGAPETVNTMPDKTLLAFADHGKVGDALPVDGGGADQVLDEFESAGIEVAELGVRLQREGAQAFDGSWNDLLQSIEEKGRELAAAG
jgi:transaldolase